MNDIEFATRVLLELLFYNGAHQTEDEFKVQLTKLRSITKM